MIQLLSTEKTKVANHRREDFRKTKGACFQGLFFYKATCDEGMTFDNGDIVRTGWHYLVAHESEDLTFRYQVRGRRVPLNSNEEKLNQPESVIWVGEAELTFEPAEFSEGSLKVTYHSEGSQDCGQFVDTYSMQDLGVPSLPPGRFTCNVDGRRVEGQVLLTKLVDQQGIQKAFGEVNPQFYPTLPPSFVVKAGAKLWEAYGVQHHELENAKAVLIDILSGQAHECAPEDYLGSALSELHRHNKYAVAYFHKVADGVRRR